MMRCKSRPTTNSWNLPLNSYSQAGQKWAVKFKIHKHIGLSTINENQIIIAKFFAATSHPDNIIATFGDASIIVQSDLDAASAVKLMGYLLDNLDGAIATTVIGAFIKVPDIYTKLFPPPTVVQQQSMSGVRIEKEKVSQPLAAVAVGVATAAKGGAGTSTTTKSPHSPKLDNRTDGLCEINKHNGVFKCTNGNKLSYLNNTTINPNKVHPPPKLTIGGTDDQEL